MLCTKVLYVGYETNLWDSKSGVIQQRLFLGVVATVLLLSLLFSSWCLVLMCLWKSVCVSKRLVLLSGDVMDVLCVICKLPAYKHMTWCEMWSRRGAEPEPSVLLRHSDFMVFNKRFYKKSLFSWLFYVKHFWLYSVCCAFYWKSYL